MRYYETKISWQLQIFKSHWFSNTQDTSKDILSSFSSWKRKIEVMGWGHDSQESNFLHYSKTSESYCSSQRTSQYYLTSGLFRLLGVKNFVHDLLITQLHLDQIVIHKRLYLHFESKGKIRFFRCWNGPFKLTIKALDYKSGIVKVVFILF